MSTNSTILELENLSYYYTGNWSTKKVWAVKDLSLAVNAGEAFGFLGHNGAGKTTTIKCILGLIRKTQGQIRIFGEPCENVAQRRLVGYLPEHPYFYDYLTVQEIMQMYATLAGIPRAERKTQIATALDLVKVSFKSKAPMRSLSKGLTQRVAMAQAIVAQPKLLILDEPFSGLDPIGRREFRDLMVYLKSIGTAIFMCSHILGDVEFLCDRVSIMARGELKGIFEMSSLPHTLSGGYELVVANYTNVESVLTRNASKASKDNRFLVLSFKHKDEAEQALRAALDGRASVNSFRFLHGSLEDLFVKLVQFDEASGGIQTPQQITEDATISNEASI